MNRATLQDVFEASRFSEHLRLVDHIHTDDQRGRLYEVVDRQAEGAGKARTTPCRTKRCRDFALRVYDVHYSAETYGLDPYMLRQTQGMHLQHPNLLRFYDTDLVFDTQCQDVITPACQKAYLMVLMELASGNLSHWLKVRRQRSSLHDIVRLSFGLLNGLAYLHANGWVHRRLHPANILMVEAENGDDHDTLTAKIGDFQDMASYSHSALPLRDEHSPYTSPEILLYYDTYCPASDMWSFGILLFEMLLGDGRTPFVDRAHESRWFQSSQRKYVLSRIFQWLGTPDRAWREKYTSSPDVPWDAQDGGNFRDKLAEFFPEFQPTAREEPLLDLIERCLKLNPDQRISALEALRHPAFQNQTPIAAPLAPPARRREVKASIPRGAWADLRYDIVRHAQRDVEGGFMQYFPTLMALYIFDRCPALLAKEQPEPTPEFIYSCFCAAYMIALKMLVDLPDPLPDLFAMTKGIVCGASESNRVNVLFLERTIVQRLHFHFATADIMAMPVTPSIFATLLRQPFTPYRTKERSKPRRPKTRS